jgi:hypothetical protein
VAVGIFLLQAVFYLSLRVCPARNYASNEKLARQS